MFEQLKPEIGRILGIKTILIEPTNDCQLNCVTCYRKGREVGYMTMDTFDFVLSKLPVRTYAVNLNGAGEPLLHPRLIEMVNKLDDKRNLFGLRYKIGFSTNGLLFDKAMQDNIVDKVDWINISGDGIGQAHESRRRGSNWGIVSHNTRMLINRQRRRTKVSVNLTRMNQSDEEIDDFKEYWKDADSVFVTPWHDSKMQIPNKPMTIGCNNLTTTRLIYWNGDVTTCCGDLLGINVYGNIRNKQLKPRYGKLCEKCNVGR